MPGHANCLLCLLVDEEAPSADRSRLVSAAQAASPLLFVGVTRIVVTILAFLL